MSATRVTPDEINRMIRLYKQYGTYAAVAREMGCSAKTIARYVKLEGVLPVIKLAMEKTLWIIADKHGGHRNVTAD